MFIWSKEAIEDLTNFIEYASNDTKYTARNYVNSLIGYTNLLSRINSLGVKIQNIDTNKEIRQLIYKSHKIIYEKCSKDIYYSNYT